MCAALTNKGRQRSLPFTADDTLDGRSCVGLDRRYGAPHGKNLAKPRRSDRAEPLGRRPDEVAKVAIDASYEGDLLAAAGVGSEIGREPAGRYVEDILKTARGDVAKALPRLAEIFPG
jgi:hypothetical protein